MMRYSYCCLILVAWFLNQGGVCSYFVYLFVWWLCCCGLFSLLVINTKCKLKLLEVFRYHQAVSRMQRWCVNSWTVDTQAMLQFGKDPTGGLSNQINTKGKQIDHYSYCVTVADCKRNIIQHHLPCFFTSITIRFNYVLFFWDTNNNKSDLCTLVFTGTHADIFVWNIHRFIGPSLGFWDMKIFINLDYLHI